MLKIRRSVPPEFLLKNENVPVGLVAMFVNSKSLLGSAAMLILAEFPLASLKLNQEVAELAITIPLEEMVTFPAPAVIAPSTVDMLAWVVCVFQVAPWVMSDIPADDPATSSILESPFAPMTTNGVSFNQPFAPLPSTLRVTL